MGFPNYHGCDGEVTAGAHNFSLSVFTFQKRWLSLRHLSVFDNLYLNVLTDVYYCLLYRMFFPEDMGYLTQMLHVWYI